MSTLRLWAVPSPSTCLEGLFLLMKRAHGQLLWHSGARRSSTATGSPAPDVQRDTAELVRSLVLR